MTNFQMQFNKNVFGLVPGQLNIDFIPPNKRWGALLPIGFIPPEITSPVSSRLEIAIANSTQQVYFYVLELPTNLLLKEQIINVESCANLWITLQHSSSKEYKLTTFESIFNKYPTIYLVARKETKDKVLLMYSLKFVNDIDVMMEITVGNKNSKVVIKSSDKQYIQFVFKFLDTLL
ncbi:Beta-adaptin appendage C-terminal subdomain domain-containing protein [Entamoeba marina]